MTYNILGLIMLLSVLVGGIGFIVAMSTDVLSKTSEMGWNTFLISGIVFVICILSLTMHMEDINKSDCQALGGVYMSVYRASDLCLKEGKIIKTY